jgi:hypothetical protein
MNTRGRKLTVWGFVVALLLVFGAVALNLLQQARSAADYSAHAALTVEIWKQLASTPDGQLYPDALSQLHLTYPDGGSTSLLSRFSYHSNGTNCTVCTVLNGRDVVRSFP